MEEIIDASNVENLIFLILLYTLTRRLNILIMKELLEGEEVGLRKIMARLLIRSDYYIIQPLWITSNILKG
jgi:hypothetical protein